MEFLGFTQTEQLKAIGAKLSEARQQKSISLEEIAAKTFIPLKLLTAIEAGRLEQLPEPVFIQGFIRRFGDALGLDGGALSKEFSLDAAAAPASPVSAPAAPLAPLPSTPPVPAPVAQAAPVTLPPEVRQPVAPPQDPASFAAPEPNYAPAEPRKRPLLPIAVAIGLGALALIVVNALNRPKPAPETAQKPQPTKTTQASSGTTVPPKPSQPPATTASASPAATATPAASPSASPTASGPVEVKMNITEDSWVEVLVDGQPVYDGILTKGTQKTWSAKRQVVISAGNAGGVSVSYNNAAAKPIGVSGEVKTESFPPTP